MGLKVLFPFLKNWQILVCMLHTFLLLIHHSAAQLSYGYYDTSCPGAEKIAKSVLEHHIISDLTSPAALLRLAFHDCQVGGCDASILLNSNGQITSELVSDKNFGIRDLKYIDLIKSTLEAVCPGVVSCADIVAMAARDGISLTGGPNILIPTGRRDSTFASNRAADAALPPPSISVDQFLNVFRAMGMNTEESVAILGAHTLGVGHCVNIVSRIYPGADSKLNPFLAAKLKVSCPVRDSRLIFNATTVQNDITSLVFDNKYYKGLTAGFGLFAIDAELAVDQRTAPIVSHFAENQGSFFSAFSSAYAKLTSHNVLVGNEGQIRRSCRYVN